MVQGNSTNYSHKGGAEGDLVQVFDPMVAHFDMSLRALMNIANHHAARLAAWTHLM